MQKFRLTFERVTLEMRTKRVWLMVVGETMPPSAIDEIKPFSTEPTP